jgi:hypothetical protein
MPEHRLEPLLEKFADAVTKAGLFTSAVAA